MVQQRADIFVKDSAEVGMTILPYCGGFFISIPCANGDRAVDILHKEQIYIAAVENGVRVAVCSLPLAKVKGLAEKIKKAIEKVNQ